MSEANTLFEIDRELDSLLDQIEEEAEENGTASPELLIHGMLFHIGHWQANEWRNSRGAPLQHQGLWRELLTMNERMNIHWQWIRGHSRHPFQTRADALAYQAARTQSCCQPMAA